MNTCSPSKNLEDSWTCFDKNDLEVLITAYNKIPNVKKIDIKTEKTDSIEYKKELWYTLRNVFSNQCENNESCWLDNKELQESLKKISPEFYNIIYNFTLKPRGLEGKYDWLSTNEIKYVMQQYEKIFPDFKFIDCVPSDYYELHPNLFPTYIFDHYKRSAIVFNLDEAHQKGSHWIAIFFENLRSSGIFSVEYFDSTGSKPNKNLKKFLNHVYFKSSKTEILINKMTHQKGDSECGIYSIFYIIARLYGKTFGDINKKRISDTTMNQFRNHLFRPFSKTFTLDK